MPGDIILFAGKTVMNKVQRLVTGSKYDHVALLTRDQKGRLQVLEATGGDGVSRCYWSEFSEKGWNEDYQRIVHRHLHCERNAENMARLYDFIDVLLYQQYIYCRKQ